MKSILARACIAGVAVAVVLGGVALWRFWTDQNNTLPIDQVLRPEHIAKLPDSDEADGPVVVQLGQNFFALVNPTRRPIYYTGYPGQSVAPRPRPGEINPLYDKQFRDAQGAWQSNVGGWCGTGSAALAILPGQAGTFDVHTGVALPPERQGPFERVGVTYWLADPAKAKTVWSEPFVP